MRCHTVLCYIGSVSKKTKPLGTEIMRVHVAAFEPHNKDKVVFGSTSAPVVFFLFRFPLDLHHPLLSVKTLCSNIIIDNLE